MTFARRIQWLLVAGALACKTGPSTPAETVNAEPAAEASAPRATVEPSHPWPVTLLDVRGHEPLPDSPRQDVWIGMDGIGATMANGVDGQIEALRDGHPPPGWAPDYVLPVLHRTLAEHATKGTLVIWADERAPIRTVTLVLYTAASAGFTDVAFVVGKPSAREIVRADLPQNVSASADFEGPAWGDLSLVSSPDGVRAFVRGRYSAGEPQPFVGEVPLDVGAGSCVLPGGPRSDPATVQRLLDELCARGQPFALRVRLEGVGPIGDILWSAAADRRPASCRLPTVVEAGLIEEPPRCDGAQTWAAALGSFPARAHLSGLEEDQAIIDATEQVLAEHLERERRADSGSGFGGRGRAVPVVKQGKASVLGSLDADIVRRIVRAHINEVRHCYDKGLQREPTLAGRIEVAFTIGGNGKVNHADVASSTLADAAVAQCVAKATRKWKFPKPSDAKAVDVVFPFELSTH